MNAAQNETASEIKDVTRAVAFSISVNLSDRHALTMQTHVDFQTTAEEMDALVDKLARRADRQVARYRFAALCKQVAMNIIQYRHMIEDVARIDAKHRQSWDSKKRGEFKLNVQQEAERGNVMMTKTRFLESVRETGSELTALAEEAGVEIPKILWDKMQSVEKASA